MRNYRLAVAICSLLFPTLVFAAESGESSSQPVELLYQPAADTTVSCLLKVDVLDVTLDGESTYMTGTASAKVLVKFSEPPPGNSATVMTVTVSKMQGQTMGEQLAVTQPEVIQVTVDDRGRVVGYRVKERVSNADAPAIASADALTGLVIFGVLPRLPAEPVAPGSQWHWRQVVHFIEVGQVTWDIPCPLIVDMQCRLIDISDEQIVIESSGQVTMPEVQIPNPFALSGTMKATNLTVTISRLRQVCQPGTLVVSQAQCEATATFMGVQSGYTLPLGMKFKFSVKPPPPPAPE